MEQHQNLLKTLSEQQLRERGGIKWEVASQDVLPAWVAEMDFGIHPAITAALQDIVERGELGYVAESHRQRFREAVAGWFNTVSGEETFSAKQVKPLADVIEGYRIALRTLVQAQGEAVLVPTPTYPPLINTPTEVGARTVQVPMIDDDGYWTFDYEALARAAREHQAKVLVLCHPANPTGRSYTRKELEKLSDLAAEYNLRVVSDEIHAPLTYGDNAHIPFASISEQAARQAITLFSPSKAFNVPSLKCAAMLMTNPDDEQQWVTLGPYAANGSSIFGLIANTVALSEGQAWLEQLLEYLAENKELLHRRITDELGFQITNPEATYLAFVQIPGSKPIENPLKFLLKHGVRVNDGAEFGSGFERGFRVNFATSREILNEIIDRIVAAYQRVEL